MLPPQLEPAGVTCPLGSHLTQSVPFWSAGWDSVGWYLPKVHSGLPIRAKAGFYFSPATSLAPGLVGLIGTLFGTKSGGQWQGIVIFKKWPLTLLLFAPFSFGLG